MKKAPNLAILKGLLFTYSTENAKDLKREKTIASKDVNNEMQLSALYDELTKSEFFSYRPDEQKWFLDTINHYLLSGENFESVFYLFDTYFEDEITDKRAFMRTLVKCLTRYHEEGITKDPIRHDIPDP